VFGFLGPNGAGKTTTLKLLMQLIFPTSGRAEILGRPVGDIAMRRRIGYLPENPSFYDYLTAEELLTYFAQLLDVPAANRRHRVETLLDRVGIGRERRLQLRKFSKGMIQRVGIAQALLNEPEVIFLDEPMSGLDPLGRRDVRSLILELRDQGRTVFFSSHILADAEALCSRVAIVAGGRLAAAGRLSELTEFEVRGWELVVANLDPASLERFRPLAARVAEIGAGRYTLELPLSRPPERLIPEIVAAGATLVSMNPVRDTLEDFFVQRIAAAGVAARTGGEPHASR
jgi:ABC-2 type transport system ATP-binding protein